MRKTTENQKQATNMLHNLINGQMGGLFAPIAIAGQVIKAAASIGVTVSAGAYIEETGNIYLYI